MKIVLLCCFVLMTACSFIPKQTESEPQGRKPYKLGLVYSGTSQQEVDKILELHELKRGQILIYETSKTKQQVNVYVYPMRYMSYENGDKYWYLKRLAPLEKINNLANYNKPKGFFFSIPKENALAPAPIEYKGEVASEDSDINYFYTFLY